MIITHYTCPSETFTMALFWLDSSQCQRVHAIHYSWSTLNDQLSMLGIATREHAGKANFRNFRWQLFHTSLGWILKTFKPAMLKPEVTAFRDGHYQHVIYGFGPYIADYKEQALLACIVCNWCPQYILNLWPGCNWVKSCEPDALHSATT